jgi:hypothetical protein
MYSNDIGKYDLLLLAPPSASEDLFSSPMVWGYFLNSGWLLHFLVRISLGSEFLVRGGKRLMGR